MSDVKKILDTLQELKLEIESVREEQSRGRAGLTSLESHSAPEFSALQPQTDSPVASALSSNRSRALMCKGNMKL